MTDQTHLLALRADLKRKLTDGTYDPMAERLIKWVRRIFPRLPKGDLAPFLVLSLGHFFLVIPAYLWDGPDMLEKWAVISFLFSIMIWAGIFLYARLYRQLYQGVSQHVIDSLLRPKDVHELDRHFNRFSNTPLTLLLITASAFMIMPYISSLLAQVYGKYQTGVIIASITGHLANGLVLHHLLFLMAFPLILSRYHIDLYEIDPGATPSIRQLSLVIRNSSYQLSIYATAFTLYMFYIMRIPVFPVAYIYLTPLLGIFIFRQIALSLIVGRSRWTTLERLRAGMEKLNVEQHFDNPAIQNQYKSMLDYYNRVKNAEAGVFDARTGMLIFNSFLLPLIAFVFFQFDRLVAFLERFIH